MADRKRRIEELRKELEAKKYQKGTDIVPDEPIKEPEPEPVPVPEPVHEPVHEPVYEPEPVQI